MKKKKLFQQILMKRKQSVKWIVFIFYLLFLSITIVLLVTVSIYCYLIKYKRKHLLPFQNIDNKLNKFYIDSINWKWKI